MEPNFLLSPSTYNSDSTIILVQFNFSLFNFLLVASNLGIGMELSDHQVWLSFAFSLLIFLYLLLTLAEASWNSYSSCLPPDCWLPSSCQFLLIRNQPESI
uniref:Uncharacterized protein n=1 Tax=Nelumbo nucifera TaxID=4432 RepID=A0A822YUE1_NELNU|nr:TPA_asm: hypothetical protein HUJ06_005016 [Nelumbo nucifera]